MSENNDNKKKLSTESYKGVRDFYPADMSVLNYIFLTCRKTVESFGYVEYGASILEPSELYRSKGNDEIINEQTYTFTDRGDREVTLRPEMTPTVARMVAGKRRELSFPLRWYSIPNLFRYERPQRGRLREHYQLNVDIFGVPGIEAEIEIISVAYTLLKNFGLSDEQFVIKVNDKAFFRNVLAQMGLDDEKIKQAGTLLDKRGKIDTFDAEWKALTGKDFDESAFLNSSLTDFVNTLKERGVSNAQVDPTLVRGFEYYSGIVFEVFDTNPENKRSLFGGGRYDNLASLFGEDNIPAVGFGMGDVTIRDVLETYGLVPNYQSTTDLYICVVGSQNVSAANALATELRDHDIKVAVDFTDKKVGDQIKKANKDGIPYVLVLGDEEVASGKYTIKNLESGEETPVTKAEIPSVILRG